MGKAKRAHLPASAQGIDGHGLSAFGVSTSFRLPAHPTFFLYFCLQSWVAGFIPR